MEEMNDRLPAALLEHAWLQDLFAELARRAIRREHRYKMSIWAWQQTTVVSLAESCLRGQGTIIPAPSPRALAVQEEAACLIDMGWDAALIRLRGQAASRADRYAILAKSMTSGPAFVFRYLRRDAEVFMAFADREVCEGKNSSSLDTVLEMLAEPAYA